MEKNVLRIENSVETNFLPESELPLHARLTGNTPDFEGQNIPESFSRLTTQSGKFVKYSFIIVFYISINMKFKELSFKANSFVVFEMLQF